MVRTLGRCGSRMAETYDLEGVGNNAGGHELLSVVAAVHHERVGQTLDDGALSLAEALGSIAASSVGEVDRGADLDVVAVKSKLVIPILVEKDLLRAIGGWCGNSLARVFRDLQFFHPMQKLYPISNKPSDVSNRLLTHNHTISTQVFPRSRLIDTHVREMSRISTSS